jgi:MbtH protein
METPAQDDMSIDGDVFMVLVNDEDQHALWPAGLSIPAGWHQTGPVGSREICRGYVDQAWTDITPASLRRIRAQAPHEA